MCLFRKVLQHKENTIEIINLNMQTKESFGCKVHFLSLHAKVCFRVREN